MGSCRAAEFASAYCVLNGRRARPRTQANVWFVQKSAPLLIRVFSSALAHCGRTSRAGGRLLWLLFPTLIRMAVGNTFIVVASDVVYQMKLAPMIKGLTLACARTHTHAHPVNRCFRLYQFNRSTHREKSSSDNYFSFLSSTVAACAPLASASCRRYWRCR